MSAPRGALALMFDPVFGALFWGKMLSVVAVWTHSIIAAVVMYEATGSALMVGLVGVVQFGPQLILSPISGKWADTGNAGRQILLGRVLCMAGSGAVAIWLAAEPGLQGFSAALPVLLGSTLVGFGFVVGGPAMQSIVPDLIREGELSTAMALNSIPMTIGRILGPAAARIWPHTSAQPPDSPSVPACTWRSRCCSSSCGFRRRRNAMPTPIIACAPRSPTSGATVRCCWR